MSSSQPPGLHYVTQSDSSPDKGFDISQKKTSVACTLCQKKKTKCSGGDPCQACISRSSSCVYDISSDKRRKAANQRNLEALLRKGEELRRHRLLLGGILAIIRADDAQMTGYLLKVIKSPINVPDLEGYVQNAMTIRPEIGRAHEQINFQIGDASSEEPSSPPQPGSSIQKRDHRFSQDYLNNPPICAEAKPWTVLASSEVVSHLLSLFFTWEQPLFQFIDKTSFLAGFKSQDFSNIFCSRVLVHAILAHACYTSNRPDCKALQTRLFSEARLYLELEAGRASITTLQALLVMYQYENSAGRDRIGRTYRYQAIDIYRRLGFTRTQERPCKYTDDDWQGITTAIWGTFAFDSLTSSIHGFTANIRPPLIPLLYKDVAREDLDERDGTWTPYPMIRPSKPAGLHKTMTALIDLALIFSAINGVNDLQEGPVDSPNDAMSRFNLFDKLNTWQRDLDPALHSDGKELLPHFYYLHMFHHIAYIILFRPVQEEEENLSLPSHVGGITNQVLHHATEAINTLFQLRSFFSFEHSPAHALACSMLTSYTLVAHLNTSPYTHPAFTRACQALHEQRLHLPAAPFLLAGLILLGRNYGVRFNEEDWRYLDGLHFPPDSLSNIPMDLPILLDIGDNQKERGPLHFDSMGEFLAQWAGLKIGNGSPESSQRTE